VGINNGEKYSTVKWFSEEELHFLQDAIYRRAIYEIKPNLNSGLSAAIGQIRTYARFLMYYRWDNRIRNEKLYDPELILLDDKGLKDLSI
jgi:hypothetical protein